MDLSSSSTAVVPPLHPTARSGFSSSTRTPNQPLRQSLLPFTAVVRPAPAAVAPVHATSVTSPSQAASSPLTPSDTTTTISPASAPAIIPARTLPTPLTVSPTLPAHVPSLRRLNTLLLPI